jgi:transcriptional regulator with XRE-family HTH domain
MKNRIREARMDAGFTQAELVRRLGIKRASISQWESGLTQPSTENLNQVAAATKKPITFFFVSDGGEAARIAMDNPLSDQVANDIKSLPPALRTIAEHKVADLAAYSRLLPEWLRKQAIAPPADPKAYEEWEAAIESDMKDRLRKNVKSSDR